MKNTTFKRQLLLCISTLAIGIAVLGLTSLISIARLSREADESTNLTLPKVTLFGAAKSSLLGARLALRSCMYYAQIGQPAELSRQKQDFYLHIGRAQQDTEKLKPLLVTARGKQVISDFARQLADYRAAGEAEISALENNAFDQAARVQVEQLTPTAEKAIKLVDDFMQVQSNYVQAAAAQSAASTAQAWWTGIGLLVVLLLITAAVVGIVLRLSSRLRKMAEDVTSGASHIAATSEQVSASSQTLAQGASEQAASIEEVTAAVEEISAMTSRNADAAVDAAEKMTQAQAIGEGVRESVDRLQTAIHGINDSSGQIAKILRAIDEIAFQTNILALNAAVEAARAGEAGAGFAVVAEEVRALAQRSAEAAKDTAALVERSVTSAREGKERLEAVQGTWRASGDIRDAVKQRCDDVATGSREQSEGLRQINQAISQMNTVTQNTAAQAEEEAAASAELSQHAANLSTLAGQLRSVVG